VHLGLALPQYDFSVPGPEPLDWPTLLGWATAAEAKGIHSLWLSDHIVWAIDRYGAAPGNHAGYDPIPTLAALARHTTTARLGTLVLNTPMRPPAVAAKALSAIDQVSNGRLTVGLGAGWFEPDFELAKLPLERPGTRLQRLADAIDVMRGCFTVAPTEPFTHHGPYYDADRLRNRPGPVQQPAPPIWLGGKGPKLVELAVAKADGWNYCWQATPEEYGPRAARIKETRPDFTLSLGLYTLVGEDEADLRRRFDRLQRTSPQGVLDGMTLDQYRQGRLVGTVEEVREQLAVWSALGVTLVVACLGAVPFSVTDLDDLDPLVAAVS
jgi:alkanesulfonate monooxygenase SsuD/methylene tetrahydromethanopterin reductase-like flavin-dependent oxidoreductase (luciferase family)